MPSTSLRDIAYDADSRTLDVTFISSGKRYRYFAVEPDEYEALKRAFSKGSWFNTHIKPAHDYELLFEASAAASPLELAPPERKEKSPPAKHLA